MDVLLILLGVAVGLVVGATSNQLRMLADKAMGKSGREKPQGGGGPGEPTE